MKSKVNQTIKNVENKENVENVYSDLKKVENGFEGSIIVDIKHKHGDISIHGLVNSYTYERDGEEKENHIPAVRITENGAIRHESELHDTENKPQALNRMLSSFESYVNDYEQYIN